MANSLEDEYIPNKVPQFHLIATPSDKPPSLADAWHEAVHKYISKLPGLSLTIHEGRLEEIDPDLLRNDCIAIPTNSYGIMDGGYDSAVSEALKGDGSERSLTDHCQEFLMETWNGYAPPGSCTIIPLPQKMLGNKWSTRFVALMPSMRDHEQVDWHHDLVYNSMWTLLSSIMNWNKAHANMRINSVLMTGLGTGAGGIPLTKCAEQMVLAVRHFHEGLPHNPRWRDLRERNKEISKTVGLDNRV